MHIYYSTENNRNVALLILFITILFLNYGSMGSKGTILSLLEIAFIAYFYIKNRDLDSLEYSFDYKTLIFIFVFEAVISIINFSFGTQLLYKNLFLLMAIFVCCSRMDSEVLIKQIRNIGIVLSILGVYEFLTRDSIFYSLISNESKQYFASSFGRSSARVRLIFMHPIICGAYSVVFIIMLLNYPLKNRFTQTIAVLFAFVSLIGTQSRSSFLSLAIVLLLLLVTNEHTSIIEKNSLLYYIFITIISIVIIGLSGTYIIELLDPVLGRFFRGFSSTDSSNYLRTAIIGRELQIYVSDYSILEKIFGRGYASAINILKNNPVYRNYSNAVDNQFITILMDTGIIGLASYITFICAQVISIFKNKSKIAKVKSLSILSLTISSFFYEMLSWEIVSFILFTLVSLPTSGEEEHEPNLENGMRR